MSDKESIKSTVEKGLISQMAFLFHILIAIIQYDNRLFN